MPANYFVSYRPTGSSNRDRAIKQPGSYSIPQGSSVQRNRPAGTKPYRSRSRRQSDPAAKLPDQTAPLTVIQQAFILPGLDRVPDRYTIDIKKDWAINLASTLLDEDVLLDQDWDQNIGNSIRGGLDRWMSEKLYTDELRNILPGFRIFDNLGQVGGSTTAWEQWRSNDYPCMKISEVYQENERVIGGFCLTLNEPTIIFCQGIVTELEALQQGAGTSFLTAFETAMEVLFNGGSRDWLDTTMVWMYEDYAEEAARTTILEKQKNGALPCCNENSKQFASQLQDEIRSGGPSPREIFNELPKEFRNQNLDVEMLKIAAVRTQNPRTELLLQDILELLRDLDLVNSIQQDQNGIKCPLSYVDVLDSWEPIVPLCLAWTENDICRNIYDDYLQNWYENGQGIDVTTICCCDWTNPVQVKQAVYSIWLWIRLLVRIDRILQGVEPAEYDHRFDNEKTPALYGARDTAQWWPTSLRPVPDTSQQGCLFGNLSAS